MNLSMLITGGVALGAIISPLLTTIANKVYEYRIRKFNFEKQSLQNELKSKKTEYSDLKLAVENYIDSINRVIVTEHNKNEVSKYSNGSNVHEPYSQEMNNFMNCTLKLRLLINDPEILKQISRVSHSIRAIDENSDYLNNLVSLLNKLISDKASEIEKFNGELRRLLK